MNKINPELISILACPKCKSPVFRENDFLRCRNTACGLRYPIRDEIPIMLIEEALPRAMGKPA